jgi:SAM-dependent methyltransferase
MSASSTPGHRWHAALYDFLTRPAERRLAPLRGFAAGEAAGCVLEVGAGTGANLPHYDWSHIESLDLTDPDVFMLERLRTKVDELPPGHRSRVTVHRSPAESLPFLEASFDQVVCTLVLCSVVDPVAALAELWRVLKPEGELRLVEHVAAPGATGTLQRAVQPVYGWFAGGCHLHRNTEAGLRAAGFEVDVTQRLKFGPFMPAFSAVARRRE